MGRLSHKDLDSITAFLQALYAEMCFERLPQVMLDGLARLIPCEHCGYNEIDSQTNSALIHMRPLVTEVLERAPFLEAHFAEHPQLNHYRTNPDRTPYQFTDFVSHRRFRDMGIYHDFYRHVDTENQLACLLSDPGALCDIGIGLNRKYTDFSERDRAVLQFLRPHLIQARANALVFTRAERKVEALSASTDELHMGVATLDREGRLLWATPKAVALLEQYFPAALKNSKRLPETLDRWVRECRERLAAGSAAAALLGPLIIAAGASRLKVRLAPGKAGHRLLLHEEQDLSPRLQAGDLGFTAREAEVMQWLIEGKTNPEIATILGTSPRTIDKHLERIFAKLGVPTRSAAVREVLVRQPNCRPSHR